MYLVVLLAMRISGKRELGQISSFDFVVAVMLGDLAVITIENHNRPLWHGLIPIALIILAEVIVASGAVKSRRLRVLINGEPEVLIANGKLIPDGLRRARMNVADLIAQVRQQGVPDIADVDFAIMETNGKLSIIPRPARSPVTPADLGLKPDESALGAILVIDGWIDPRSLARLNRDEEWLLRELAAQGVRSPEEVLVASLSANGQLYVARKVEPLSKSGPESDNRRV